MVSAATSALLRWLSSLLLGLLLIALLLVLPLLMLCILLLLMCLLGVRPSSRSVLPRLVVI